MEVRVSMEELRQLQSIAKRPCVLSFISSHFRSMESEIFVSLEGVEQEKIDGRVQAVKFHLVLGKNHRLMIPKLNMEIIPEKSQVIVKPKDHFGVLEPLKLQNLGVLFINDASHLQ